MSQLNDACEELHALLSIQLASHVVTPATPWSDYPTIKLLRAWERRHPAEDRLAALSSLSPKQINAMGHEVSLWFFEKNIQHPDVLHCDVEKIWNRWSLPPGHAPLLLHRLNMLVEAPPRELRSLMERLQLMSGHFAELLNVAPHHESFRDLMMGLANHADPQCREAFKALDAKVHHQLIKNDHDMELQLSMSRQLKNMAFKSAANSVFEKKILPQLLRLPVNQSYQLLSKDLIDHFGRHLSVDTHQKLAAALSTNGWEQASMAQLCCPHPNEQLLHDPKSRSYYLPLWHQFHPQKLLDLIDQQARQIPSTIQDVKIQKDIWKALAHQGWDQAFFNQRYAKKELRIFGNSNEVGDWISESRRRWHSLLNASQPSGGSGNIDHLVPHRVLDTWRLLASVFTSSPPPPMLSKPFAWPKKDQCHPSLDPKRYQIQSQYVAHCQQHVLSAAVSDHNVQPTCRRKI